MSKKKKPKTTKSSPVVYDEWDLYPHFKNEKELYAERLAWLLENCESVAYTADDVEENHPILVISSIGRMDSELGMTMFCYNTKKRRFAIIKQLKRADK
jgi:hypothetical protein